MTPVTRKVRVRVPATSANLGSGFDTVGLALDYHDELEFTAERRSGEHCGSGDDRRRRRRYSPA